MTQKYIEERTAAMKKLGYSNEDIQKCLQLDQEFEDELEKIEEQCEAEGYPARGSNFELRAAQLEEAYQREYDAIEMKYEM